MTHAPLTARRNLLLLLPVVLFQLTGGLLAPSASATCGATCSAKLLASDGSASDEAGIAVAVSGDAAIVGAHLDDPKGTDSGAAYIYAHRADGTPWAQEQKLAPSDGAAGDRFGASVGISGAVAVVGAYSDDDKGTNAGSAYVFRFDGSTWVQEQKLLASDGAVADAFGYTVAIDGEFIIVGAYGDDDKGTSAGAAYLFRYDGSIWMQEEKLLALDGAAGALFGWPVAVSGHVVVVGARKDDNGSAYVYRSSTPEARNGSRKTSWWPRTAHQATLSARLLRCLGTWPWWVPLRG